MKSSTLQSIEQQLPLLSRDELMVIEQLAKRLRRPPPSANFEAELIEMANDPEIQEELRAIATEFTCTEQDGLEGL